MALDTTPHLGLPLPHPDNSPRTVDVPRLRAALTAIDTLIKGLQVEAEALEGAKADKTQVATDIANAVSAAVADLLNGAPEAYDTLKEIADKLGDNDDVVSNILSLIGALQSGKADLGGNGKVLPEQLPAFATPTEAQTGTGNGVMTAALTGQAIEALAPRGYQEFLASGTWHKPADANWVYVEVCGGGGGGGSGRKVAISTNKAGGAGGSAAPINRGFIAAADLPSSVGVIVGAGGAGGAPQINNSADGNAGSNGGDSSLAHLYSQGGAGGAGGSHTAAGGVGRSLYGVSTAGNPTAFEGSATASAGAVFGSAGGGSTNWLSSQSGGSSIFSPGSGGGGGSEDDGNVLHPAAAGGTTGTRTQGGGAPAGVSHATDPTPGGDGTGYDGGGGGGSANGANVSGARGGHGGRGAGGGGGGSCRNGTGNASGAGGNGGDGFVRVWWG